MKACGIDKRVISTLEGRSVHDINNAIVDFVQQYPDQLLGCAVINPKEDDCVEEARRVATMPWSLIPGNMGIYRRGWNIIWIQSWTLPQKTALS